jgi:dTDP-glucose 4,6-dehydratase
MNILITGGCGFIGSNLIIKLLKNKKNKILNLDKINYASNIFLNKRFLKYKNYKFKKIDIKNSKVLEKLIFKFKPNYIFHLAAESHVDRSIDSPKPFIESNIIGTFNLLEAIRKYLLNRKLSNKFVRLHHISTDEVYGDLKKNDKKFRENTSYNPSSPYSASKASSDHLVRAWGRTYNLPYVITNCSNNFGSYQFPEKFIPHIILCLLNGKKIPIYGNGKQIRDWISVEDHVDILIKLMRKKIYNDTFNIGGNNEIANINIAKQICSILKNSLLKNKKIDELFSYVPDRPGHDVRYAVNCTKIERILNFKTKNQFNKQLRKTVFWYLNNEDWCELSIKKKYKLERLGKF